MGSRVLEEVAEAYGDGTRWFQLYPASNPRISQSLVRRAEASGYRALVITVDTPVMGWRPRDLRHGYYPFSHGHGLANYLCDPAFRAELGFDPADDPGRSLEYFLRVLAHDTLDWSELTAIRCMTSLPVLVKGILHPQDAQAALQHGFDGLIVSNHGGRHLDGFIPALYALPGIVRAVDDRIPVLFDSGVRTGDDVLKAMALGARAVLVGRPYVYGLAVAGVEGVSAVFRQLVAELDISMIHARCRTLNDVHMTPSPVRLLPDGGNPSF
jgi:L-lactate dehydrogenase (cytochrome)